MKVGVICLSILGCLVGCATVRSSHSSSVAVPDEEICAFAYPANAVALKQALTSRKLDPECLRDHGIDKKFEDLTVLEFWKWVRACTLRDLHIGLDSCISAEQADMFSEMNKRTLSQCLSKTIDKDELSRLDEFSLADGLMLLRRLYEGMFILKYSHAIIWFDDPDKSYPCHPTAEMLYLFEKDSPILNQKAGKF